MKTQVVTVLTLIIAGVYATGAIAAGKGEAVESLMFPASYKVGSVSNGGTIAGTVKFEGTAPAMKKLEITKNPEVCGLTDNFDESVVVGEGSALKNTIIYLMDISSGAGFSKDAKVKYDSIRKAVISIRMFVYFPSDND